MSDTPQLVLVGAVAAVGVLHTMVPDHWVPIALIARQRGWSRRETASAACLAGTGHVVSTLLIAAVVWVAGAVVAERFGQVVDTLSSVALIAFGGWVAVSAWRELRRAPGQGHGHYHHHHGADHAHFTEDHNHALAHEHEPRPAPENDPLYAPLRGETAVLAPHIHAHRHGGGSVHVHWHDHTPETFHTLLAALNGDAPLHQHRHKTTARMALLLILGSSPMVEGIPAFFAAGRYGGMLIAVMAIVFALSTIITYVLLCVSSTAVLQNLRLGSAERYGEVLSGALIALVGLTFWIWPVL